MTETPDTMRRKAYYEWLAGPQGSVNKVGNAFYAGYDNGYEQGLNDQYAAAKEIHGGDYAAGVAATIAAVRAKAEELRHKAVVANGRDSWTAKWTWAASQSLDEVANALAADPRAIE